MWKRWLPRDATIERSLIGLSPKINPHGRLKTAFHGDFFVILHMFLGAKSAVTENIEKGHEGTNPVIPRS